MRFQYTTLGDQILAVLVILLPQTQSTPLILRWLDAESRDSAIVSMAYGHRDSNSSTNSICPKPTLSPPPRQWLKLSRRQAGEHRHRHRHLSATKFHTASTNTGKADLHHRNHPNASLELANPHEFQPPQSELPALLPDRDAIILNPWSRREASFPHKNF